MNTNLKEIRKYPKKDIKNCIEIAAVKKWEKGSSSKSSSSLKAEPLVTNPEPKNRDIKEQVIGTKIGLVEGRKGMTQKEIDKLQKSHLINIVADTIDKRTNSIYDIYNQVIKALGKEVSRNFGDSVLKMYNAIENKRGKRYNNPNKTMVIAWCIYYTFLETFGQISVSQNVLLERISKNFSNINTKTLNISKNEVQKILTTIEEYSELVDLENELIQKDLKCDFDKKLKETKILKQVEFVIKMIEDYDDTIHNYVKKYRPTVEVAVLSFLAGSTNIDDVLVKYRDKMTALNLCNVSLVNSKIYNEVIKILAHIFK